MFVSNPADWCVQFSGKRKRLLACFAGAAVEHGVEGAGVFLGFSELLRFCCCGCGLGGHHSALFFLHVDGGLFNVAGLEGAEVVGGLEAFVSGAAIRSVQAAACARTLHLGGGEEEVHGLGWVDPLLAAGGRDHDGVVWES